MEIIVTYSQSCIIRTYLQTIKFPEEFGYNENIIELIWAFTERVHAPYTNRPSVVQNLQLSPYLCIYLWKL